MKLFDWLISSKKAQRDVAGENDPLKNDQNAPRDVSVVPVEEKDYENSEDLEKGERRRISSAASEAPQLGIYWRSPITMIVNLVCGCGFAGALHGFYSGLDHGKVGNPEQQQTALR